MVVQLRIQMLEDVILAMVSGQYIGIPDIMVMMDMDLVRMVPVLEDICS